MITVGRTASGRPIAPGFVGLSLEIGSLETYAGTDSRTVHPLLEQLIRNLTPGQRPVLRLGGDSTDWTWWPIPQVPQPPGVTYSLTGRWLAVARALVRAIDARLILGVNLEADSNQVAAAEAQAMVRGIGRHWIDALELGNEPELYGTLAWFHTPAGPGSGRDPGWDVPAFLRDYSTIAHGLPRLPLAGPSTGSLAWMRSTGHFLASEPPVKLLTLHGYPLQRCGPTGTATATIRSLLSDASARGLAQRLAPYPPLAHARGISVRVDEMGSVSCGGQPGVSDTFASSLWVLDALFQLAHVGVDGVNIHTRPNSANELFTLRRINGDWEAIVHPEYYALLMFAEASPPGSRLLPTSGPTSGPIHVWATHNPDGHIRLVLINKDPSSGRILRARVPAAAGRGTLELLRAPSISATDDVTLAGQGFGTATATGTLAGPRQLASVSPHAGIYTLQLPALSATVLTLSPGRNG
jgi:hypothetical protein